MRNFYFESVTARGTGKQESTITFTPGLNIIQGRSNTGKTAISAEKTSHSMKVLDTTRFPLEYKRQKA